MVTRILQVMLYERKAEENEGFMARKKEAQINLHFNPPADLNDPKPTRFSGSIQSR